MDTKALANTRCNPHQLGNERGTYLRDVSASSVGAIKLPAVVEAFYLPGVRNLCQNRSRPGCVIRQIRCKKNCNSH